MNKKKQYQKTYLKRHPLRKVWDAMKRRCEHEGSDKYYLYGARGIKVVWKTYNEFEKDMLLAYKKGLQIDRIDNNGNYCKENCRWATRTEQANNKRNNVFYRFKGISLTVPQWARRLGINKATLKNRLIVAKWPIEDALTKPVNKNLCRI